ncbi:MAG TPA: PLP-dependent aminotransferase family protein [Bradyrhizobium sp.]|nr:PLP-dependent aminotransferase family protein [Bradyrhizobium sp.]
MIKVVSGQVRRPTFAKSADHLTRNFRSPTRTRNKQRNAAEAGWATLYDWQEVDRRSGTSVTQQTYLQVRSAILSRSLGPGTKVPSTRNLASRLGVARTSVIAAYEQLHVEGYLTAKPGSGTFIATEMPEPIPGHAVAQVRAQSQIDGQRSRRILLRRPPTETVAHSDVRPFNTGRTLVDARTLQIWRRLVHQAARMLGPEDLGYTDPRGSPGLRQAICQYLQASRAVRCEPEQIIVTAGTQHAIDLAIRILLRPGDAVWTEDPGYPLTRQALISAGMVVRAIPVDKRGLDVETGARVARRARAAFVTPSHQYPTGVVLSMTRRLDLLAWARENGAWIIEDDYASEFRYSGRPLASLQGLDDAERVIYIGTLNKALFPGLRLGYMVVPWSRLQGFVEARILIDRQPPSLHQTVVADFMTRGHFASHIRRMREQYRRQRDALAGELVRAGSDVFSVDVPDQGMHLVAHLRGGISDVVIEQAASRGGLAARAMSRTYVDVSPRSALILGFSGYPSESIVPAAGRLARLVRTEQRRLQGDF